MFTESKPTFPAARRWSLIGNACTSRMINIKAWKRMMYKAWGLKYDAVFKDLGENLFLVHFGGEGDWRHARNNGPCQFDLSALILKDYDGKTRPSEMVFDKVEAWVRIKDLPIDKRTEEFGIPLGNWLGEVVKVDVDNESFARAKQLRVRANISMFEPLAKCFNLKKSKDDLQGIRYDFLYEKIPHFCFDCGRLVHVDGNCDSNVEQKSQWGEWLRASPGKYSSLKFNAFGASNSYSGDNSRIGEGRYN